MGFVHFLPAYGQSDFGMLSCFRGMAGQLHAHKLNGRSLNRRRVAGQGTELGCSRVTSA